MIRNTFVCCFVVFFACVSLSFAAPVISSSQNDSFPDANADLKADPGEQITYETSISNTGPDAATSVVFNNPIPTDTTQTGGVISTPLARDDAYTSIGNVGLTVPTGTGLLANDFDLGPTAPTVVVPVPGTPTATTGGGSVTITAGGLGGFTYTPPAGFTGQDTFTYTIADETGAVLPAPATGSNISTVTIDIEDMIWFIDNTGTAGNGTLASPFNALSQHNSNGNDSDGDCIFVYTGVGNYGGGIVLQNSQILIGQGSTADVATSCGITPPTGSTPLPATGGTRPVLLNAGGNGISLASGNTVRGLNIGSSSGTGLVGTSFGTATISEVSVTTGGVGIDLNTGTLAASFDSVTKTSSASDGIVLTSVAGSADFGAMSITSTGAGRGIRLDGTGVANSTFSGSGTISSGTGTAVDLSDCTLGTGSGVTLTSVSSAGGGNPGINLDTIAGTLTVNGGIIENKLDTDGVRLSNTADLISLNNMIIEDINGTGDASPGAAYTAVTGGPASHHSGADGIHGENVMGGLALNTCTLRRFSDNAINGELLSGAPSDQFNLTTWVGLTLQDCIIEDSNRYHRGPGQLDAFPSNYIESQVNIHGISGQVTVDGCTFRRGSGLLHLVSAASGTLRCDITDNDFSLSGKEMTPANLGSGSIASYGGAAIEIYGNGTADLDVIIGDINEVSAALGNTFLNCGAGALGSIRLQSNISGLTAYTGEYDAIVSRNTLRVTDHLSDANPGSFEGFPFGTMDFVMEGNGTAEAAVSHNAFDELFATGVLGAFTYTTGQGMAAELRKNNNTHDKSWNATKYFQAFTGSTQINFLQNNSYIGDPNYAFNAGDDAGAAFGSYIAPLPWGPTVTQSNGSGSSLDFHSDNNDHAPHDTINNFDHSVHSFDFEVFFSGQTDVELDNNGAPGLGFEFHQLGGTGGNMSLFRDATASTTITTILSANGNITTHSNNSGGAKVLNTTATDPTSTPTIVVP